jgi:UDP-2-acetamido-3-amino-2,3-dideoxy-glucuronate N-acetyltransferase
MKYFIDHLNGHPIEVADAESAIEVLEILEKASESLLDGGKVRAEGPRTSPHHGEDAGYFVHPTSEIDNGVVIGAGTKIWNFSKVLSGSRIGERCNIGQNVVIGPDVAVGNGCKIQNNVSIFKGVTLEDEIFCGPSMVFTNVYNPRAAIRRMDEIRKTLVKKGATIGANATIVCGVTIGRYAFVGAGAVVLEDVRDHALVVGNPARQTGWICECAVRLNDQGTCTACGKSYPQLLKGA